MKQNMERRAILGIISFLQEEDDDDDDFVMLLNNVQVDLIIFLFLVLSNCILWICIVLYGKVAEASK